MASHLEPRAVRSSEVPAVCHLINRAYEVEHFFVTGDRVTPEALAAEMSRGTVYVVDGAGGRLRACVYTDVSAGRGYFGMLAVDPDEQGQGLGRALIAFAEDTARAAGARVMTISVVNVRQDLLAFYGRLGYVATGTAPYVHRPVSQPVHFILMEKPL